MGEYINEARAQAGMSLYRAGQLSGVDSGYWQKVETGELTEPKPRYLVEMARTLDVAPEDLYALAGYAIPERLPELAPYLRAKYRLPADAVADLNEYLDHHLRSYYDIPDDQPVFPAIDPEPPRRQAAPDAQARNPAEHPWRHRRAT